MSRIKASKTELKRQRDSLARYRRYLPTLRLKQQQLQVELRRVDNEVRAADNEIFEARSALEDWVELWVEDHQPADYLDLVEVRTDETSVAGVTLPTLEEVKWQRRVPPPDTTPPWLDEAVQVVERLYELRLRRRVLGQQRGLLADELRLTSQRVNLFEKVKIPETEEALRVIRIALGDLQAAEVVRAKIAKAKSQERERAA